MASLVAGVACSGAGAADGAATADKVVAPTDAGETRAASSTPSTSATISASTSTSTTATTSPPTTTTSTEPPSPVPARPLPPPVAPAPPTTVPVLTGALCIGDSVMLGAGPQFRNTLAMCGAVDAVTSRQITHAHDVLAWYVAAAGGAFPPAVVIGLGTNGVMSAGLLDHALAAVAGTPLVVLVTAQLPETTHYAVEDAVNAEIRAAAARHPGRVVIADWELASEHHPEYFGTDGIHVASSQVGAEAYAATIGAALAAAPLPAPG